MMHHREKQVSVYLRHTITTQKLLNVVSEDYLLSPTKQQVRLLVFGVTDSEPLDAILPSV